MRDRMQSWEPLADRNPLPGDPIEIRRLGDRFGAIGAQAETHAAGLDQVESSAWKGEAADKFREFSKDLPVQLKQVGERYMSVGAALRAYAPKLEEAQENARAALEQAQRAAESRRAALLGIERMRAHYAVQATVSSIQLPGSTPAHEEPWSGPDHESRLADAESDLGAARRRLQTEVQNNRAAANACADAIDVAADDPLRNPTGVAAFGAKLTDWAETVSFWAGTISAILSVAALLLCWVPGVNAILATLAILTGALALAADGWLFAHGERDKSDLAWSAAGVLTGGVGKVAGAAAKASHSSRFVQATGRVDQARAAGAALAGQRGAYVANVSRLRALVTAPAHAAQSLAGRATTTAAQASAKATRARDAVTHMPAQGLKAVGANALTVLSAPVRPVRSLTRARKAVAQIRADGPYSPREGYARTYGVARQANGAAGVAHQHVAVASDVAGAGLGARTLGLAGRQRVSGGDRAANEPRARHAVAFT